MNKVFYGDNLDVMRRFIRDESVDLCYIDPPFNSKRNYNQIYNNIGQEDRAQAQAFVDTWTWWGENEGPSRRDSLAEQYLEAILTNERGVQTAQSVALIEGLLKVLGRGSLMAYLVSMTIRIAEIHRALKPTGSFYLHCDPTASHYLKLICDALFVPQGGDFKNEIVWERTNAHNIASKYFARVQDVIFFYVKSKTYTWNPIYTDFSPQQIKRYFKDPETGRMVTGQDLTMMGNQHRNFTWRGATPPANRGWGYDYDDLENLWESGLILTKQDGTPRLDGRKVFLDEKNGKPLGSIWTDIERIGNTSGERLGYPTQKPEPLLERIIAASSKKGDVVLDAFCGCGTSVVVAHRLKRRFVGIDITYQSVSLVLKRLQDAFPEANVLEFVELHGVPRDMPSVDALINKRDDRVRKEFEKWAVLTYSNNRAVINDKKGADKGIDGTAYLLTGRDEAGNNKYSPVILSVKSGNVGAAFMRDLRGTIERENAAVGVLITRNEPTRPMIEEAKAAGQFKSEFLSPVDRLQIVTVQQILDGERMNLPLVAEVAKKAQKSKVDTGQNMLGFE